MIFKRTDKHSSTVGEHADADADPAEVAAQDETQIRRAVADSPLTDDATAEEITARAEAEEAAAAEIGEQLRKLRDEDEADHAETERQIEGIRAARARRAAAFGADIRPRDRLAEDLATRSQRLGNAAAAATKAEASEARAKALEEERDALSGRQADLGGELADLAARKRDLEPQLAAALDGTDFDLITELRNKLDTIRAREERLRARQAPLIARLTELGDGTETFTSHPLLRVLPPLAEARRQADMDRHRVREALSWAFPDRPEAIADAERLHERQLDRVTSERIAAEQAERARTERRVTYATGRPGH